MAYSDYGAFVYKNGDRRTDKEDAPMFASSEEAFGMDINQIPSGMRIFQNILHTRTESESRLDTLTEDQKRNLYIRDHVTHGVMGDGPIRVRCYKQGLPTIWKLKDDGYLEEIEYPHEDPDEYDVINFGYEGYKFKFTNGSPYRAVMIEPDGTTWICFYDYEFGAGFEESDFDDSTT